MRAMNLEPLNVKQDVQMTSSDAQPGLKSQRCYYVDWLRVLAMAAVFILHSARFFDHIGWHVKDPRPYFGFTLLLLFIHQWTMPLFFLLSGAASWFSLGTRSGKDYTGARLKRLLIPYIFGILVIIPPQKFLEAVSQRGFDGNYFEFLGRYFNANTLWIDPSLQFFGHYGYHLWFLGFLAVFSLAALPLFKALRKENALKRIANWGTFFERPGRIFLLLLPVAVIQIALRPLFPNYLSWADTVYWAIFFLYGNIIFSNHQFGQTLVKHRKAALVIGIGCFSIMTVIAYWGDIRSLEMNPGYSFLDIFYQLLRSINTWAWIMFILGMGKKHLDKNSKTLKYSNEAVLPFYILHQTIILIFGFFVVQWNVPVMVKFAVIILSSFMGIMILYELIKRIPLTRFLFGMRKKNPGG
jgi:surface polysaccharide O-acyltransferase-like enzyme